MSPSRSGENTQLETSLTRASGQEDYFSTLIRLCFLSPVNSKTDEQSGFPITIGAISVLWLDDDENRGGLLLSRRDLGRRSDRQFDLRPDETKRIGTKRTLCVYANPLSRRCSVARRMTS